MMAIRFSSIISDAKQVLKLHSVYIKNKKRVPKGHVAVYIGATEMKRYVVPLTYLSHPSFQELLRHAEEEFGYSHPMGGLTIPCKEEAFISATKQMNSQ